MTNLNTLVCRKVIDHYQLPEECINRLINTYEVYVPL